MSGNTNTGTDTWRESWLVRGIEELADDEQRVDSYRAAVEAGRPVALLLHADECSFLQWDADWLAREAGRCPVKVYRADRNTFGLAPGAQVETEEVPLAAYLAGLREPRTDSADRPAGEPAPEDPLRYSYLRQLDVEALRLDREHGADGEPPAADDRTRWQAGWLTEGHAAVRRNLWVGTRGIRTNLHFDLVSNIYVQVQGRKTVWLAPPQDLESVYPYAADSHAYQTSQVDWQAIDADRFPRASEAGLRSITLEPGQALHIPAFWWHELESEELSVSVNIWWLPPLRRCLVPGLLRRLVNLHGKFGVFAVDKALRDGFRLDGPDWAQELAAGLLDGSGGPMAGTPDGAVLALLLLEAALARRVRSRLSPPPAGSGRKALSEAPAASADSAASAGAARRPEFTALIGAAASRGALAQEDRAELLALVRSADQGRAAVREEKQADWPDGEPAATVRAGLEVLRRLAAG